MNHRSIMTLTKWRAVSMPFVSGAGSRAIGRATNYWPIPSNSSPTAVSYSLPSSSFFLVPRRTPKTFKTHLFQPHTVSRARHLRNGCFCPVSRRLQGGDWWQPGRGGDRYISKFGPARDFSLPRVHVLPKEWAGWQKGQACGTSARVALRECIVEDSNLPIGLGVAVSTVKLRNQLLVLTLLDELVLWKSSILSRPRTLYTMIQWRGGIGRRLTHTHCRPMSRQRLWLLLSSKWASWTWHTHTG